MKGVHIFSLMKQAVRCIRCVGVLRQWVDRTPTLCLHVLMVTSVAVALGALALFVLHAPMTILVPSVAVGCVLVCVLGVIMACFIPH